MSNRFAALSEPTTEEDEISTPDDSQYEDAIKGQEDAQMPPVVFLREYVFPEGFDIKTFEEKTDDPLKQLVKLMEMTKIKVDNSLDLLETGLAELLIFKDSVACQEMPTLYNTLIDNAIHNLYQQMVSSQNLNSCKDEIFNNLQSNGEEALQILLTREDKSDEEVFELITKSIEGSNSEKTNFQKIVDGLQINGEILGIGNDSNSTESLELNAYSRDFKLIVEGATMQQKKINEELLKIIKENPEKSVRDAKISELMGQYNPISLDEFKDKVKLATELGELKGGGGRQILKALITFLAATTGAQSLTDSEKSVRSLQKQDSITGNVQRQDSLKSVAPFSLLPTTTIPIPPYKPETGICSYQTDESGKLYDSFNILNTDGTVGVDKFDFQNAFGDKKNTCASPSQVNTLFDEFIQGVTKEVQEKLIQEGISMDLVLKDDDGNKEVALNKPDIVGDGLKKLYSSYLPEETKLVAMSNLLATTKTPFTNEMLKQLLGPDAPVETELGLVSGFPTSDYEDRQLVIQIFKKTGLERVVPQSTIGNTVTLYGELIKKNSGTPRTAIYDVTQQLNLETYKAIKDFFKSVQFNLDSMSTDISSFLKEDPQKSDSKISVVKRDALLEYLETKYVEKKDDGSVETDKVPKELKSNIDEMFVSFREGVVSSMEVKVEKQNAMFETSKGRISGFISMIQDEYVKNQQQLETQKEKLQTADKSYTDEKLTIFTKKVVADNTLWGQLFGTTKTVTDKTEYNRRSLFKSRIAKLYESRLKSDMKKIEESITVGYSTPQQTIGQAINTITVARSSKQIAPQGNVVGEVETNDDKEKKEDNGQEEYNEKEEAKKGIAVIPLEGDKEGSDVGVVKIGPVGKLKPVGPSEESRNALQLFKALSKKEQKVIPTITAELRTTDVNGTKNYELVYVCDKCMNNNYLDAIPQLLSEFAQNELIFNQYLLCHNAGLDVETCLEKLYAPGGREEFEKTSATPAVKSAYAAYINSEQQFEGLEVVGSIVGLFQTFPTIGGYPDVAEVNLEKDEMNEVVGLYNEFNATSILLDEYLTTKIEAGGNLRKFAALFQSKKDAALKAASEAERTAETNRMEEFKQNMKHAAKMIKDKATAKGEIEFLNYFRIIDAWFKNDEELKKELADKMPTNAMAFGYHVIMGSSNLFKLQYMSFNLRIMSAFLVLTALTTLNAFWKMGGWVGIAGFWTFGNKDPKPLIYVIISLAIALGASQFADSTIEYLLENTPVLIGQFNNLNTITKLVIGGATVTLSVGTYFLFRTKDGKMQLVKGDERAASTQAPPVQAPAASPAAASTSTPGARRAGFPSGPPGGPPGRTFVPRQTSDLRPELGGYVKHKVKKSTNKNRKVNKTKHPKRTLNKNKKSKRNSSHKKNKNNKANTKKRRHTIRNK